METKIFDVSISDCAILISELEHLQTLPSVSLAIFSNKNLKILRETIDVVRDSYNHAVSNIDGYNDFIQEMSSHNSKFQESISDIESKESEEYDTIVPQFDDIANSIREKYKSTIDELQKIENEYINLVGEKHPIELFVISFNNLPTDINGKSIEMLMFTGLIQ